jgi:hypothetical protein
VAKKTAWTTPDVDSSKLYTQPEDVALAYEELSKVSDRFTIAAAFGNVHGVYKPGNVKLQPIILKNSQDYVQKKFGTKAHPVNFVFHGGSGSTLEEIREAISYGVIKMNIDTDLQWAFWDGVMGFYKKNEGYLQGQIGNPEGDEQAEQEVLRSARLAAQGRRRFPGQAEAGLCRPQQHRNPGVSRLPLRARKRAGPGLGWPFFVSAQESRKAGHGPSDREPLPRSAAPPER